MDTGPNDSDGRIMAHPTDWKMLGFALGSVVDAGSPSPYSHTISELNNNGTYAFTSGTECPPPSFTLELAKVSPGTGTNSIKTIKGAVIAEYSLSIPLGELISEEITYMAQSEVWSSGAATAVTDPGTRSFKYSDAVLQMPSGTAWMRFQT